MSEIIVSENASAPSTPDTGTVSLYAKTDSNLYYKNDAGTETQISATASASTPDNVLINGSFSIAQHRASRDI